MTIHLFIYFWHKLVIFTIKHLDKYQEITIHWPNMSPLSRVYANTVSVK